MSAYSHKPQYLHKLCLIKCIIKASYALNFYSRQVFKSELKYSAHCQNLLNNIVIILGYYRSGEVVSTEENVELLCAALLNWLGLEL